MKDTILSFKVEAEFKETLEEFAKKENRSVSNYVQTVLMDHINQKKKNNLLNEEQNILLNKAVVAFMEKFIAENSSESLSVKPKKLSSKTSTKKKTG